MHQHRRQRAVPVPGPIPPGMMRISADIPMEQWEAIKASSRRRGVGVDHLLAAALDLAATA